MSILDPTKPASSGWVNVERWGLTPEPVIEPTPAPVREPEGSKRVNPSQLRPRGDHEKHSDKKRAQLAKRLVARAPGGFECKPDCGKCCEQPVDMLYGEWAKLERLPVVKAILLEHTANGSSVSVVPRTLSSVKVGTDEGHCPFLDARTKKCRIYDQRPYSCRAYGQHWFAWCGAGVECPPALELTDKDVQEWGKLGGYPYGTMPIERWPGTREVVEAWRKLEPETRRDMMPSFDEVIATADKIVGGVPAESIAHERLMAEMAHLRKEAEAKKPKTEEPQTSNEAPPAVFVCTACQSPVGEHCQMHVMPCCPGKCSGHVNRETLRDVAEDDARSMDACLPKRTPETTQGGDA